MSSVSHIFYHTSKVEPLTHPPEKEKCLTFRLNAVMLYYELPQVSILPEQPEQFIFSTDRKQKYLIIDKANPRKVRHIAPSWYPCHVAFCRNIVQIDKESYQWKLRLPNNTENVRLGIYFGYLVQNFKSDFGHHSPRLTSAETYLVGPTENMAGIDCGNGRIFGGKPRPKLTQANVASITKPVNFENLANQVLQLDLDSTQDTLTITSSVKTHTFVIERLQFLRLNKKFWEAIFWVSIGDGPGKREVEIISFSSMEKRQSKL